MATPRDQCNQHLACQPHERVVALERHSLCKLIFTPRPSRCAYTLDKYVNDKLKIIRAFPVTILVVGNEISLAGRKRTSPFQPKQPSNITGESSEVSQNNDSELEPV